MDRYDAYGTIEGDFQCELISEGFAEADNWVISQSNIYIAASKVADAMRQIKKTKGKVLQSATCVRGAHGYEIHACKRAKVVIKAMQLSAYESGYERSQKTLRLSPYIHAFFKCKQVFSYRMRSVGSKSEMHELLQQMIAFAKGVYAAISTPEFRRELANLRRSSNKLANSVCGCIDDLSALYARLTVVRLDLSYYKSSEELQAELMGECSKIYSPKMDQDRIAFFTALSHKESPYAMVGYMCKLEHMPRKGFHFHVMLFLNGSKVQDHIGAGKRIGEFWCNEITQGRGRYWNVKPTKFRPAEGVGRLDWHDEEKLYHVKEAAMYLVKVDEWVKVYIGQNRRKFYKSVPKKRVDKRGGRPRVER
jgi:hypothetical protein